MNKLFTAVSASAATLILTIAPAFAAQTSSTGGFMIADLSRDSISLSKSNEALPTVVHAVPADFPQQLRDMGYSATAIIKVDLTVSGKLARAIISKSTGNRTLDMNALYAVSNATFAPGTVSGSPVGGSYAVRVEFNSEK